MQKQFWRYLIDLYQTVPKGVYEGLLLVLFWGLWVMIATLGLKRGLSLIARLLFLEYVFLLLCSTIFFRVYVETRGHNFTPFWSYKAIQEGRIELIPENMMNVVVYIPVGMLLSIISSQWKMFHGIKNKGCLAFLIVVVGLIISVSIEALQYFLRRGFSEFDDVFQ